MDLMGALVLATKSGVRTPGWLVADSEKKNKREGRGVRGEVEGGWQRLTDQ